MNRPAARYEPLSPVVVRAPVLSIGAYLALAGEPHPVGVRLAPTDPLVRAALAVASPELLDQLDSLPPGTRDADRAAAALERYLIRMSTRPTPFGMFAAVGLADLGDHTDLRVESGPPRTRMRPDMEWLLRFVAQLEERPDVRRELRVTTNPSVWTHGDRVLLAERTAVDGSGGPTAVDIRASGVVRRALALAREPIVWRELTTRLAASTGAMPERVDGLLTELWRQSFLITELRPPLTHPSPARHVEQRLAGVVAARHERGMLTRLLADMAGWDESDLAGRPQAQRTLSAPAEQAVPGLHGPPVQVDAALRLQTSGIHARVADMAARATELLLRLGPPSTSGGLDGYRRAFVSRYGADREVALLELLDPERGLGAPSAFTGPPTESAAEIGRRNAYLHRIALDALRGGHIAVHLDTDAVAALFPPSPPGARAPVSVDLAVAVLAHSADEIDRGEFRLVIGPNIGAQAAGRNLGRFADLLGPAATNALTRIAMAVRERQPDRLHAELVYLPQTPRTANVAVRPPIHDYEVVTTTTPGVETHHAIALSELLVGVRAERFYVRWPHAPGDIMVHTGHMLNPRGAPEACRFLEEVARDERASLVGFSWGPAGDLPFLPRVELDRVVLSLARWRIDAALRDEQLPPRSDHFLALFARWRHEWKVPRYVYLGASDRRLLLDLDLPAHVEQVRPALRRIERDGPAVLHEALPGPEHAWLEGDDGRYVPELVVSLVQRDSHAATGPGPHLAEGIGVSRDDRLRPPGTDWLFVKLYGAPSRQDELVAGPVRTFGELAIAAGLARHWFLVRYADPDPHLRLRFTGDPNTLLTELLPQLCDWAGELLADGRIDRITVDTYEREVERYGGAGAMSAIEEIFAIDTVAAVELVALPESGRIGLDATELAVLSMDTLLGGLGLDEPGRLALYRRATRSRHDSGTDYRRRQRRLRQLLGTQEPGDGDPDGVVTRVLTTRTAALADPVRRLARLSAEDQLTKPWADICHSLVHMHCNRLWGTAALSESHLLGLALRTREGLDRSPLPPHQHKAADAKQ